jgi:hypothetical protein
VARIQAEPVRDSLLRGQRNDVYRLVSEAGFQPEDFAWDTRPSDSRPGVDIDRLAFKGTDYFFTFDKSEMRSFAPTYSPGLYHLLMEPPRGKWSNALSSVRLWLASLRREVETPDLWAGAVATGDRLAFFRSDEDNSPFTEMEVRAIGARIVTVKQFIAARDLPAGEYESIEKKLDYLVGASRRTGRLDWKNIAVTTVLALAAPAALNSEQARQVFEYIVGVAQRLLASG